MFSWTHRHDYTSLTTTTTTKSECEHASRDHRNPLRVDESENEVVISLQEDENTGDEAAKSRGMGIFPHSPPMVRYLVAFDRVRSPVGRSQFDLAGYLLI